LGAKEVSVPWFVRNPDALRVVEGALKACFPTLHAFIEDGKCRIRGTLPIVDAGHEIDRYQLEIALPDDYPASAPRVWETADRIPRNADRHVFIDGALCLGTPLSLWIALEGDFTIDKFLNTPVRNFLIGNSLIENGEPWPHSDRSHGAAGLLEHIKELVGTARPGMVASFLKAIAEGRVNKHSPCPCLTGKKLFKCHREGYTALRRIPASVLDQTVQLIVEEYQRGMLAP
jgi:hypothetical protein